jgi:uncharacterized integral membrane protein
MTSTDPPASAGGPASGAASAPTPESRAERLRRRGRRARLYTWAFSLVALLAVLVVLISRNTRTVKLDWAFGSARASLVWIILVAAVLGWLLGIVTSIVFRHRTRTPR